MTTPAAWTLGGFAGRTARGSMSRASTTGRLLALVGALGLIVTAASPAFAAGPTPGPTRPDGTDPILRHIRPAWDAVGRRAQTDLAGGPSGEARLLVRFRPSATSAMRRAAIATSGAARLSDVSTPDLTVVRTTDAAAAIAALRRDPNVLRVTVDGHNVLDADPRGETYWQELWGLHNAGQRLYQGLDGTEGKPDADVDVLQAHGITTGLPSVVVAVIDDGVDFSHPDLAGRAWTNPGESGSGKEANGIDDDGNGKVDDVNGWDFCNGDNTVHDFDEDFHGTHVAGTIAASLNGAGVVGVAPSVKVMALKFIKSDDPDNDCGMDSQAIAAIEYAASFGVRIVNASWGRRDVPGGAPDLFDAIAGAPLLFVASAGNDGIDNDHTAFPAVPASFDLPNVLTVAAIDNSGGIPDFSNYGATTVDIAGPGVAILSTLPADQFHPQPGYGWLDGTSMATPHVTGVAALVASFVPGIAANPAALRSRLLASGKSMPATAGWTATGRIVDALRALDTHGPTAPPPTGASLVRNSILASTKVSARVGWPVATDDLSGINAYGVGLQVDGGAWQTYVGATTARTTDRDLKFSHSYIFRVRARDGALNWGPYATGPLLRPALYQETSAKLTFSKSWKSSKSSTASGGKSKYSAKKGATASFTFTGRAYALVAPKSSGRGKVKLYVDGVFRSTIDLHRSKGLARVLVATGSWAATGAHTVKLVVVGTKGHARVDVDAFVILR
jgi:subtilisin family serine protease